LKSSETGELNFPQRFFGHLKTIWGHKRLVRRHCFSVGLYRQGICHDWSKYSPVEFWAGVRYYTGHCSPNRIQKETLGYSAAWLHHKGRNKHHLEYWIDNAPTGDKKLCGMKMPYRYLAEMFCDRVAASENYNRGHYQLSDAWEYYRKGKDTYLMHPETRAQLEELLQMLMEQGEEKTFSYLKKRLRIAKADKM
jgi:hypothetical protein